MANAEQLTLDLTPHRRVTYEHRHRDRAGLFRIWVHDRMCCGCDGHGNSRVKEDAHCACGEWDPDDPGRDLLIGSGGPRFRVLDVPTTQPEGEKP